MFPAGFTFPVKLICCIAFESTSSACSYLNLLPSFYNNFWNKQSNRLCNHPLAIFWMLIIFYWLMKLNCNLLFLQLEENMACNLSSVHYLWTIKQKVQLFLENLYQLNNQLNKVLVSCLFCCFWLILIPVNISFKTWCLESISYNWNTMFCISYCKCWYLAVNGISYYKTIFWPWPS